MPFKPKKLLFSLSVLATFQAVPAFAQQRDFNVPAGDAVDTISTFAKQSGLQIIAPADHIKHVRTKAIIGRFEIHQALMVFIQKTGLAIVSDSGGVIILAERAPPKTVSRPVMSSQETPGLMPSPRSRMTDGRATSVDRTSRTPAQEGRTHSGPGAEILVTGSHVGRRGFESPTPLTVVTVKDLQNQAPTNIADYISTMPAFANSQTARRSATNVGDGNGGVSNLNLRSLGANRTLVLLDGMRVAPSSITGFAGQGGSVDINAFPDGLISRLDVVTGGASAAYGSDALAGVVNFVLDKKFTGIKGTAEAGVTTYGDDFQYLASLTAGTGFAQDRGHILLSGSLNHVNGVMHGSVRSWLRQGYDQIPNPAYTATNGQPFYVISKQVGSGLFTPGGLIASGPLRGIDFGPGGSTRMFNYGALNAGNANMIGGDWQETVGALTDSAEGYTSSLDVRMLRRNIISRVSFEITPEIEIYAEALYSRTTSMGYCCASSQAVTIQSGNPFIPAAVQAQMTALALPSFTMNVVNAEQGAAGASNKRQLNHYVLGAEGAMSLFGSRWNWTVAGSRSVTGTYATAFNDPVRATFQQAVNVVRSPVTGQPVCASTLINPGDGCIPYNPMGTGMNSPAAMAYATGGAGWLYQNIYQNDVSATMRGEPFSIWAGPVSVAAGLEYRTLKVAGLASALDEANAFFVGNYHATNGAYNVTEGFIETVVPLARDVSWARKLDLNAALRGTSYSTSGYVTTWKVGLTYDTPIAGLRLRATRSRDIRAPNLGELFTRGPNAQSGILDTTSGNQTVPNILTIRTGNSSLTPETASTTGVGMVYQPSWLPGLSTSIDYYNINISNAIGSATAQDEVNSCAAGVQTYCNFIQRDASGTIQIVYVRPANTAYSKTSGIDFEAAYRKNLSSIVASWPGTITLRGLATYVIDLTSIAPNGIVTHNAGVNTPGSGAAPTWSYNVNLGYDSDPFSLSLTGRGVSAGKRSPFYIECTSNCPVVAAPYYTTNDNHLPAALYFDMSMTYHMKAEGKRTVDLFVNVENLGNKNPNFFISPGGGVYDTLGRLVRAGVRFRT